MIIQEAHSIVNILNTQYYSGTINIPSSFYFPQPINIANIRIEHKDTKASIIKLNLHNILQRKTNSFFLDYT